jgi:hypothetical protein
VAEHGAHLGDGRQVGAVEVGDAQRAERAATVEVAAAPAGPPRLEAVHLPERRVGVLGEVGGPQPVEGDGLVLEAAQPDQRGGIAALCRVDLEHVPVAYAVDDLVDLLAGEPRAPRRRAAGAVVERAREADRV